MVLMEQPVTQRMRVELPARPLTLDDVTLLAGLDETHRYELDEGNLIIMPQPTVQHSKIMNRLQVWLSGGYPLDLILPVPGLRIFENSSGRSPDLVVLRHAVDDDVSWLDPEAVAIAIEIVSPSSRKMDRIVKPTEYAKVGIPRYWRVERESGPVTVHQYLLDSAGPNYSLERAVMLEDLVTEAPPKPIP